MINIPEDELFTSLEYGYKQFSAAVKADNKLEQFRLKGWCNALEGIIFSFKPELKNQMIDMRSKIIVFHKNEDVEDINWETPTYIRKKIKI